ncbi:MAG: GNAT family N-acetyltransferase [Thermoguttaceae bacterium]
MTMLQYRSFRNTDPPILTAIWRSRPNEPGFLRPVSVDLFEQLVFAKLHFDYKGLLLALEDERPVGFVHASFGPNAERTNVSTETGVICALMVRPDCAQMEVATGLLEQSEIYLRARGVQVIMGGARRPLNPFGSGLYGGVEPPGILNSDGIAQEAYLRCGYQPATQTRIFRQNLNLLKLPADRQQLQFRRRMVVQVMVDPPTRDWWEASTWGDFDLNLFELVPRGGGAAVARAVVRDLAITDEGGGRAVGILDVEVDPSQRRQGLATHLLGESLRMLRGQGVASAEIHVAEDHTAGVQLLRKLGFHQVAAGIQFRKPVLEPHAVCLDDPPAEPSPRTPS